MMDFATLRDARPNVWQDAADNLKRLAGEADKAARDLQDKSEELSQHWHDPVGQSAVTALRQLSLRYEVAGIDLHGAASVLYGLQEGVSLAQKCLQVAVDDAMRCGCHVDDSGHVTHPDGTTAYGQQQAIDDAVHQADEMDNTAAGDLQNLTCPNAVDGRDISAALAMQNHDANDQVQVIRDGLPTGRSAQAVKEWWNALTPGQREDLEKAVPLDLYELNGIPRTVKDDLRGHDSYDRMKLLQYARDHWNDKSIDIYDDDNNCANFVATALDFAGLRGGLSFNPLRPLDSYRDSWGGLPIPTGSRYVRQHDRAETWYNAERQYQFFTDHGAQQIQRSRAQPGDLVYWDQPDGKNTGGTIHHVAIVTSVTPDGDIHYTQHGGQMENASLSGRSMSVTLSQGDQDVRILRVHQDWWPVS